MPVTSKFIHRVDQARSTSVWHWVRCIDGIDFESPVKFETFALCLYDTRRCGFSNSDAFDILEDRRRTVRPPRFHHPLAPQPVA